MGTGNLGAFGNTRGALITELKEKGIKFTEKDIIFITRDKTGQIVWLEKGNSSAGLEHILNGNGKYCVMTGIGSNGFIVTAYPVEY